MALGLYSPVIDDESWLCIGCEVTHTNGGTAICQALLMAPRDFTLRNGQLLNSI